MMLDEVRTAEKTRLTYRIAGVGSRFLAWFVDMLIIGGLIFAGAFMFIAYDIALEGFGAALATLWSFAVQWGYFIIFEWRWQGQTPGKRIFGIRVIQWRGTAITFDQSALRNILRIADFIPVGYLVGFLVAMANRENRRLGDLAAGTLV